MALVEKVWAERNVLVRFLFWRMWKILVVREKGWVERNVLLGFVLRNVEDFVVVGEKVCVERFWFCVKEYGRFWLWEKSIVFKGAFVLKQEKF